LERIWKRTLMIGMTITYKRSSSMPSAQFKNYIISKMSSFIVKLILVDLSEIILESSVNTLKQSRFAIGSPRAP
jgi:hypothetical protein